MKVYLVIAACCLGIGLAFALHGFWPVLPFAGLEILVLGMAFYLCLERGQIREVVTVSADLVTVEKGRAQPRERWQCPRAWARVELEPAPVAWYPSRLAVGFQSRQIEIGGFLNEEERRALAQDLREALRRDDWLR